MYVHIVCMYIHYVCVGECTRHLVNANVHYKRWRILNWIVSCYTYIKKHRYLLKLISHHCACIEKTLQMVEISTFQCEIERIESAGDGNNSGILYILYTMSILQITNIIHVIFRLSNYAGIYLLVDKYDSPVRTRALSIRSKDLFSPRIVKWWPFTLNFSPYTLRRKDTNHF